MIFALVFLSAYLIITVFTSLRISKSRMLSRQQKTINIVLNALAPLLWYYLIAPIIFPKDKTITKYERDKMTAAQNGSKLGDEIGSSRDARTGGFY